MCEYTITSACVGCPLGVQRGADGDVSRCFAVACAVWLAVMGPRMQSPGYGGTQIQQRKAFAWFKPKVGETKRVLPQECQLSGMVHRTHKRDLCKTFKHSFTHTHTHSYAHMHTHTRACVHACTHTHSHTCAHTHAHTHTHMHSHRGTHHSVLLPMPDALHYGELPCAVLLQRDFCWGYERDCTKENRLWVPKCDGSPVRPWWVIEQL